ncbi:PEP-CTERM system TPR-repeat protein PrsT [Massilia sp. PAMC28688]|uniref:XrtA/PEP-CTERM system TPR-repeat protein PrsT n=1 Tax=Massilia sp. PAMC28688 TaxID=2861283 RepID=UPI001C62C948|nr:XrtA/PEP-CTERM system TPR-repeat protein PrsT [Massilia sp. PAMC28688]QYF92965.1 PEP-CTERM system TPR-repeat protein PrsT [Massilia sp. PAMC28688]
MTPHKQPLWSRSVAAALALSMGVEVCGCGSGDPDQMLAEAREFWDKGDLRAAIAHARQLIDTHDGFGAAHLLLGELYVDQGDLDEAADAFRRAMLHGDALGSAQLGRVLLLQGKHEQVLAAIATVGGPAQRAAAMGLHSQALFALLNLAQADAMAHASLHLHTEAPQALLALARMALYRQHWAQARSCLKRALAASPADLDCLRLQADMLHADGQLTQALAIHGAILERHPCNAQALLDVAQLSTDAAQYSRAQHAIGQARKVAGSVPAVLFAEAVLQHRQGNDAQAAELAGRILRAAPAHTPALLLAGALALAAGAHRHAEQLLQRFLRIHPGHVHASQLMVALHLETQHPQAALALLSPLLAKDGSDCRLLIQAATANLRARQFSMAATLFAQAADMDQDLTRPWQGLAHSRLGTGDYLRQVAMLERSMALPSAPLAHALLHAMSRLRGGQHAEAFALACALEREDDNPLIQQLKGDIALQQDDLRGARQGFARALRHDPAFLPALEKLQQLDLIEHRPLENTRNRYLAALAASPGNSAAMEALASLALSRQHPAEAISWMERACAHSPDALPLSLRACALYLQLGQHDEAYRLAQALDASHPANSDVACLLGRISLARRDYRAACAAFTRLAAMTPASGLPHWHLAAAHIAQGQDAAALHALKSALAIEPDLFAARADLVALFIRHGRYHEALAAAVSAQRRQPEAAAPHQLEGDVHSAQSRHDLACLAYQQAFALAPTSQLLVQLHGSLSHQGKDEQANAVMAAWLGSHPGDVDARQHLACCHLARHDLSAAAAELSAVLRHAPDNLTALNDLAWTCQRLGDPQALHLAQRAHALAPDNPAVMDTLGCILMEQGELARALPLLLKACTLAPHVGEVHFHLGTLLIQSGDREGARRALEKALASPPPFDRRAEAQQLLVTL